MENNELNKHKKSDTFKWIVAFTLIVILLIGMATSFVFIFTDRAIDKEQIANEPKGHIGVQESEPATYEYGVKAVSELISDTEIKVTARTYPYNAEVGGLQWNLQWEDKDSKWAKGKNLANYLTLRKDEEDKSSVVLTNLQPFGETILLTCASTDNTDISDTIKVDYNGVMVDFNASFDYNGKHYTFNSTGSPQATMEEYDNKHAAPCIVIDYVKGKYIENFKIEPVASGVYSTVSVSENSFINIQYSMVDTEVNNCYISYERTGDGEWDFDCDTNKLPLNDTADKQKFNVDYITMGNNPPKEFSTQTTSFATFVGSPTTGVFNMNSLNNMLNGLNGEMGLLMFGMTLNDYGVMSDFIAGIIVYGGINLMFRTDGGSL